MFSASNIENIENDVCKLINWMFYGKDLEDNGITFVECDSYDAFLFSELTGSTYLDKLAMPFTPRGLLKVVHSALKQTMVVGLFENGSPKYTPSTLSIARPYLFEGVKRIIPIRAINEKELRDKIGDLVNSGCNENTLVLRIDTSNKGFGLEPLLEAAACFLFRRNGYTVESQVPLGHNLGSPDFQAILNNASHLGCLTIEYSMIKQAETIKGPEFASRLLGKNDAFVSPVIVGEAKTSTTKMDTQIDKYKSTGFFDYAYEIHHSLLKPGDPVNGLLSLRSHQLKVTSEPKKLISDLHKQSNYLQWMETIKNLYLLGNFSLPELAKIAKEVLGSEYQISAKNLYELASHQDIRSSLLDLLEG